MTDNTTSTSTSSINRIVIDLPDDFHHHARDGAQTAAVLQHAQQRFGRCLLMPNLKPPLTTTERVLEYRDHVLKSLSSYSTSATTTPSSPSTFQPLFTLYLTDSTTPEEIQKAHNSQAVVAAKYYPAGATTHSESGVTNPKLVYPVFAKMQDVGMRLCLHSEVTYGDIFEREPAFLQTILQPIVQDFPQLKITVEHISTEEAVEYVMSAPENVKASITCHHLLYTRNDLLVGGIRPHLYCLPILKSEVDRQALLRAAISGNPKFFAGTDSAPHATPTKESSCGCAGIYTAHAAVELYAEAFDAQQSLHRLQDFVSGFGADHYGVPRNTKHQLVLERTPWTVPTTYDFGDGKTVTPLRAGEVIPWSIVGLQENTN